MSRQAQPHVLIIPSLAQGHVAPLMKLAHRIADHGIKVTFVNSEFIQGKVVAALPDEAVAQSRVRLESIPDGLDPEDDRSDLVNVIESVKRVIPGHLKGLIEKGNSTTSNDEDEHMQITCVISDISLGRWAIEEAEKMGIQGVLFCPFGPGTLAWVLQIPKLIEARIINSTDGIITSNFLICFTFLKLYFFFLVFLQK